ncbi:hypothetical protein QBC41DRAFT_346674 [Cercophora samala]|uniref:Uncharacterized protein n=1 Tax=Cercophora samala TaxID=330535 RepID=A0AA39ZDQ7_9PEZI|nr:hypothetical protein QBC41DRAFT_346674 [Cercophora samala]
MPPKRKRSTKQDATPRQDVILPMREPYMTQILEGIKHYEFRKYKMADTVKRAWFYRVAPCSAITHVGEIAPPVTRAELLKAVRHDTETSDVDTLQEQEEVYEQILQEQLDEHHRKRKKAGNGDQAYGQQRQMDEAEVEALRLENTASKWGQYAYEVLAVYELETPIPLQQLKNKYGLAGPPRGMVYLPDLIRRHIDWEKQKKVGS